MYPFLKRILFLLEPELAHALVKKTSPVLPRSLLARFSKRHHPELKTTLAGVALSSPIGLAAGFDKNAEMVDLLDSLGFGFLEIGSITAQPYAGNPKPRVFRLPKDQSLINRLGLPNLGARAISKNLSKIKSSIPLGINVAKTPTPASQKPMSSEEGVADFLTTLKAVSDYGAYVALNLSCPNTEDGKTFEDVGVFSELATEVKKIRKASPKPYYLKLSPTLPKSELKKLIEAALKFGFDGFILSNTTPHRDHLKTPSQKIKAIGRGGLSGRALLETANQQLKNVAEIVEKNVTLIGVGGVFGLEDVLAKMALGAHCIQIYTGLIYQGPFFVKELNRGLAQFCQAFGVKSCQELVGNPEILQFYRKAIQ